MLSFTEKLKCPLLIFGQSVDQKLTDDRARYGRRQAAYPEITCVASLIHYRYIKGKGCNQEDPVSTTGHIPVVD